MERPRHGPRSLGVAVILLSLAGLPAVFSPPLGAQPQLRELAEYSVKSDGGDPKMDTAAVELQYGAFIREMWGGWVESLAVVLFSIVAGVLAWRQKRIGVWLIVLVSAYVLAVTAPPLIRMSINSGFFNLATSIATGIVEHHGAIGLVLFWNMVLAPFAYALLVAIAIWYMLKGRNLKYAET